jgi:hypothetical protein
MIERKPYKMHTHDIAHMKIRLKLSLEQGKIKDFNYFAYVKLKYLNKESPWLKSQGASKMSTRSCFQPYLCVGSQRKQCVKMKKEFRGSYTKSGQ